MLLCRRFAWQPLHAPVSTLPSCLARLWGCLAPAVNTVQPAQCRQGCSGEGLVVVSKFTALPIYEGRPDACAELRQRQENIQLHMQSY